VIALLAGEHHSSGSSVSEILILNGFFVALFVGSAVLFLHAARNDFPRAQARAGDPRAEDPPPLRA
jgi:hypothetical protein